MCTRENSVEEWAPPEGEYWKKIIMQPLLKLRGFDRNGLANKLNMILEPTCCEFKSHNKQLATKKNYASADQVSPKGECWGVGSMRGRILKNIYLYYKAEQANFVMCRRRAVCVTTILNNVPVYICIIMQQFMYFNPDHPILWSCYK